MLRLQTRHVGECKDHLLNSWAGLQIYLHDPRKAGKSLKELIAAAGAKLLSRAPPDAGVANEISGQSLEAEPHSIVLVADDGSADAFKPPVGWHGTCVDKNWLIDSASNYCVQPFDSYLV